LDQKKEWNLHFETYLRDLDKRKPVIWTGDLNVAPTEIGMSASWADHAWLTHHSKDLANAKKNWNKTAGYTEVVSSADLTQPCSKKYAG
jgi:AP endonuclease-1